MRTSPYPYPLGGYEGVALRVRGDEHRYRVRFRTDESYDGVAYQVSFDNVTDDWRVIHVRFSDCMPTLRGRRVSSPPR